MGRDPAFEVFGFSGSAFVWRVMLGLELKKLPYEMRWMEPTQGALQSPEYLKINPRGKVPALRHGDIVLSESMAIISYLDRLCPDPSLFGDDPRAAGRIWQLVFDFDLYTSQQWAGQFIVPLFFGQAQAQREVVKSMGANIHARFEKFDDLLRRQYWLAGGAVTAADIAVYRFVESVLRAAGKPEAVSLKLGFDRFDKRYPNMDAWRARMLDLPGSKNASPPHWSA